MITPLPVPIHRRLHDTIRAVILTNEKPSLPVPGTQTKLLSLHFQNMLLLSRRMIVELTQHFADIGLDVDILEVLVGVSVEQPEGGVESDGHPDTVAVPGQQTYLTVLTRVGIK